MDEKLYEQFLSGDNKAFEELVLKHKNNLIYFLQRYVKDIYQCEDIAQDVFAYIYVCKEKYNFKSSFKTYLYTISRNKAIDYIRRNNKNVFDIDENKFKTEKEELLENLIKKQDELLVHKCLNKLKKDYQTAIHLVDFEELSYDDAAKILNKTNGQFKVLLFRARKALKNILEKEGYIGVEK